MLRAIGTTIAKNWSNIPQWGRNTIKWGSALIGAGGATVAATGIGGGALKGVAERPIQGAAELAAGGGVQQTKSSFFGMVGFFAEILKALGVGGGIPEALMNFANRGHALGGGNPVHNEAGWKADDARFGGQGLGAGGMGGPGNDDGGFPWGKAALGTAGVGGAALLGRHLMANSAHTLGAAAPGIAAQAGGLRGLLSRVPVVGKYIGLAGAVGVGGAALFGSSEAEAATPSAGAMAGPAATATAASVGTLHAIGAEVAGLGLSTLGARTAAQAIAPAAAPLLGKLGLKAIPGVSSLIAAGETLYNTTSHALKGEWTKAGLSLVSGVGETVAGLGGAATYLTLGTAWREGVRAGGAAIFGEENTIDHSLVVQGAGMLKDAFTGPSNGDTRRAASAPATGLGFQPALGLGG